MKRHRLKSRNEKIKFLNRLQAGLVNLAEISPLKTEVWRVDKKEKTYENISTGKKLTESEYNLRIKKEGATEIIKIPPDKESLAKH